MKLKNKPQINLERSSTIFGLMFVAMIIVVASILISKQLFGSIRFTGRVISKHNESKRILEQNVQILPQLKSNYELLKTEGPTPDKVLRALPTDINFPSLATLIEQLSAVSKVRLTAINIDNTAVANTPSTIVTATPDPSTGSSSNTAPPSTDPNQAQTPAAPAGPEEVTLTVSVKGKYRDILKFFDSIETAIRPMKVTQVEIKGEGDDLTADLTITTYFQAATTFKPTQETVR